MSLSPNPPRSSHNGVSIFDDDGDDGWQDMPVIRSEDFANGLDEEDRKKYHYVTPNKSLDGGQGNATGNLIDFDERGNEWRSKLDVDEGEYTRLRLDEDDEAEDVHLRTKYLFDEDKAMTPLSQMQATKNLLTEAQRIAYVGLCALAIRELASRLKDAMSKEMRSATENIELWGLKILGRLYYHMELTTSEQKMIESLADHGVEAMDLVPSLMTTHTVANPEYDPVEAKRREEQREEEQLQGDNEEKCNEPFSAADDTISKNDMGQPLDVSSPIPHTSTIPATPVTAQQRTTANVLQPTASTSIPGVSTTLSSTDANVTLDIRWTVLCDLFLLLIADSVYDSRSRVLLENVASKLGLGWIDVVKFEKRVTDALEIQEGIEKMEQKEVIEERIKATKKKRYVVMGLATLGGGLVIGLSAGLLAPVIGAGLGAAFTTIGVTGTTGFLTGAGGAALITTGGALTGSGIAVRGMARRTRHVRTFELLPLHNNKRVNCIITVPGCATILFDTNALGTPEANRIPRVRLTNRFMQGVRDDVRLPFSVLDPVVGDVFSVLWEPEMIEETGNAIKFLTGEILSQLSTTVLQATVMTSLMSALTWPIVLTKLGYLIDNPWSNALDRARAAGAVLADILIQRHLGVRPIMLIGFSLGARVIFYALLELAKAKAYGIVQDVFLLGATLTAPKRSWIEARSVVAGRFVNGYARNDWVLNYLFRATSGGINTVAGLRPIQNVAGVENVDVTDKISGHGSYRAFMPLILDQLGFPVSADYFDEPEEPDMVGDREVIRQEDEAQKKRRWFSRKKKQVQNTTNVQRPPSSMSFPRQSTSKSPPRSSSLDELPERTPHATLQLDAQLDGPNRLSPLDSTSSIPLRAGFDFRAINALLEEEASKNYDELEGMQVPPADKPLSTTSLRTNRTDAVPLSQVDANETRSEKIGPSKPFNRTSIHELSNPRATRSQVELPLVTGSSQSTLRSLHPHPAAESVPLPGLQRHPDALSGSFSKSGASSVLSSQPRPSPALSLGGHEGAVWIPEPEPVTTSSLDLRSSFGKFESKLSPAASTETLSFRGSSRVISSQHDPFAVSGLSFGGIDGSMSFAAGGDPWAPPQYGAEFKKNGQNTNPWG